MAEQQPDRLGHEPPLAVERTVTMLEYSFISMDVKASPRRSLPRRGLSRHHPRTRRRWLGVRSGDLLRAAHNPHESISCSQGKVKLNRSTHPGTAVANPRHGGPVRPVRLRGQPHGLRLQLPVRTPRARWTRRSKATRSCGAPSTAQ